MIIEGLISIALMLAEKEFTPEFTCPDPPVMECVIDQEGAYVCYPIDESEKFKWER